MLASSLFHLTFDDSSSLQIQLRKKIAAAIIEQTVPLETPLPSTRRMAKALGVSRNTVILTYEHLVADGYLVSRERAGFFVNPDIFKQITLHKEEAEKINHDPLEWDNFLAFRPSNKQLNKIKDWKSYPYPFIYGQLSDELFPHHHWRECCRDSLIKGDVNFWQSDRYDEDDPLLIEQIQHRLLPKRGIQASADEILITVGAQHALYMLFHLLLSPLKTIGIEQPGYPDMLRIAELTHANVKRLPVNGDGLIIDQSLADCNLIFTTPSHQFPTTVTMPIANRQALLEKSVEHDLLIIEDDYEAEINFSSQPTAALKSLDKHNRVIYIGSLSKTISSGLRLGFIVADRELIRELREYRRMMIRHPPTNNQHTVGLFISRGYYDSQLLKLVTIYKDRWDTLNEALSAYLPELKHSSFFGGSAFWIETEENIKTNELKQNAADRGILIESGEIYYSDEKCPSHYFRLGFSSITKQQISPGIKRLSQVVQEIRKNGK